MGEIKGYAQGTVAIGVKLLGTGADATGPTLQYDIDEIVLYAGGNAVAVPTSAAATGVAGTYAMEAGWFYSCVATNTWERVATATW